ncbi:non-homologous end-joining DNA ligase [Nocardioides sp. AE5]|uniref:non-homologous end-joining DNA ligase n=1 Tax=Nocardioides sp. AE5 TaxID=2962573 RepID=UPI0028817CE4|nr:non-homologous end-joining DNA ligase [Nocardioides sp. AE5]MDT0201867.1 non-homologous end-joining DNA ligase [Nocardioides sp. AE5]
MRPMLATRGDHVPDGAGWTHEVKWDGMRILADAGPGRLRLTSRNENDVTASFPELQSLAGRDLLLDGEVVALDEGAPSFSALGRRMHVRDARKAARLVEVQPVTFLVFDLLRLDGRDLAEAPLEARRAALADLGLADVRVQVPPAYDDGAMLLRATGEQGLEGIVSKRLSSRYAFGTRSPHWRKFVHRRRTSWVVGGWRPEVDAEHRLGALLIGEPTPDGLVFRGRVGSGVAGKATPVLAGLLGPLARAESPFDAVPPVDAAGARWVEPLLVIDVESLGLSPQGRLRQPSYRGLRTDLDPDDLVGRDQR